MNFKHLNDTTPSSATQYRLMWMMLMGFLAIAGVLLILYIRMDYQRTLQQNSDRLLSQARVINVNLEHQVNGIYNALKGIRKDLPEWQKSHNKAGIKRRLVGLREALPGVRRFIVLDADGTVQSSDSDDLIRSNFRYREYYNRVKRGGNAETLYLAPPFISVTKIWSMTASIMIAGPNGEFNGIIVATLDPSYFKTLMESVLYTPDMWSLIAHGDGLMFLLVPEKKEIKSNNLKQPGSFFSRHMDSGRKENILRGIVYATGENRIAAVTTFNPKLVPIDTPLVIMVSRDWNAVQAPWLQNSLILFLIYLLFVAGSVFSVRFMMQRRVELDHLLQFQTSILKSAGEGIFGIGLKGDVTFLNRAAERITGWTIDELNNSRFNGAFFSFCCESTPCPAIQCDIKQTLQDGVTRSIPDKSFIKRDGTFFPVGFTVAPLFEQDTLTGAVIVFHDLTERKKNEAELLRVNRALKSLSFCNKALIEANDENELLERICRILVENSGYRLAWIGFAMHDEATH